MVRVHVPGRAWKDPHKPKGVWRQVAVHLLKDLAAQPRATMQLLVVSIAIVTFVHLGLPYIFYDGRFYRSGAQEIFVECYYFGYQPFTKEGPDCPWVVWRKP